MGFLLMTVKTTLEQLEEVQAAITHVMKGQEVLVAGKRLTLADLDALGKREEMLLRRYRAETDDGGLSFNTGILRRE